MLECPKCGHHDVQGPVYCAGCTYGWTLRSQEHMHYRCRRCGYVAFEKCRDHEEATARIRRQLPDYYQPKEA